MNLLLIFIGRLVFFFSRTLKLGAGSTWPGHVAMEANPGFAREILKKNPNLKIILVAGTNGKTTTSSMLQKILEEDGLKVFRNEAGANLMNGIASSIIANANLTGRLNFDVAIFEIDERNVLLALKEIQPYAILILNIFRDQLDRYGEVNQVLKDWENALLSLRPRHQVGNNLPFLFTNGDDPALYNLAKKSGLRTYFFGIDEKLMTREQTGHDVDFIYCPNCHTKLEYEKVSFSHMGKFKCSRCNFSNPKRDTFPTLYPPLLGNYNIYNTSAAALVANKAFGVSPVKINKALRSFKPAFGRQEIIRYKGHKVLVLLSKNPAGFNQSIDTIKTLGKKGNILLVLNDRVPDGRDVSWIWDVDFENLPKNSRIFVSGDRAYDIALRMKYEELPAHVFESLKSAIENAANQTSTNEMLFILPTYSAMLEARKILVGRKLL